MIIQGELNVAPWKDFNGNHITEGDVIKHPSGEAGTVRFVPNRDSVSDQWIVDYVYGDESRLCLQVGDKGQAVVTKGCS